jgi:hypothetical protein
MLLCYLQYERYGPALNWGWQPVALAADGLQQPRSKTHGLCGISQLSCCLLIVICVIDSKDATSVIAQDEESNVAMWPRKTAGDSAVD